SLCTELVQISPPTLFVGTPRRGKSWCSLRFGLSMPGAFTTRALRRAHGLVRGRMGPTPGLFPTHELAAVGRTVRHRQSPSRERPHRAKLTQGNERPIAYVTGPIQRLRHERGVPTSRTWTGDPACAEARRQLRDDGAGGKSPVRIGAVSHGKWRTALR